MEDVKISFGLKEIKIDQQDDTMFEISLAPPYIDIEDKIHIPIYANDGDDVVYLVIQAKNNEETLDMILKQWKENGHKPFNLNSITEKKDTSEVFIRIRGKEGC